MQASVDALEHALDDAFRTMPSARVVQNIPGLGTVLGAQVLAEIGDDPTRFTTASGLQAFAGTAPITRASVKSHYDKARNVRNKRLADACHWWTFNAITSSPGARAHYDRRRLRYPGEMVVTHVTTATTATATATATVQPISVAVVNADFGSVDMPCNSRLI